MEETNLNEEHMDALKEIASVSSGNASTALSDLIGKRVLIKPPTVHVVDKASLRRLVGELKNLLVVVYTSVKGDITGSFIIILDKISMFSLIDIMRKREIGETKYLQANDQPVINELCNILNGNYLTALANFMSISLEPSVPKVLSLQGEMLVDFLAMGIEDASKVITIKTDFSVEENISGDFVLLLPIQSMDGLIKSIEKRIE